MVTIKKIDTAVEEARRFIKIATLAKKRIEANKFAQYGCKETGAVRRASMDLTRILVTLRQS